MTAPDRRRPASPTLSAAVLAVVAVLLDVVLALLGIPTHQNELANFTQEFATVPPLALLGFLIVRKQPGNKIGWLMLTAAVGLPLTSIGQPYVVMRYRLGYPLPFRTVACRRPAGGGLCGRRSLRSAVSLARSTARS